VLGKYRKFPFRKKFDTKIHFEDERNVVCWFVIIIGEHEVRTDRKLSTTRYRKVNEVIQTK
jgi:hypothetical protein